MFKSSKKNKSNELYSGGTESNMQSKSPNKKKSFGRRLIVGLVIIVVFFSFFVGIALAIINFSDAKIDPTKLTSIDNTITILDSSNNSINGKSDDAYCLIDHLPQHTLDAFVSIEDKRFYNHSGLDYKRIASAMLTNIKKGRIVEGGSTISQQIIKNTHAGSEKTFDRKIREAQLAVKLEKEYSKKQILEIYLNIIYFGNGIYGIEKASKRFFSKESSKLTLLESAMLASIPKSPTKYNLIHNFDNNFVRAKLILNTMKKQGKIAQNDVDEALKQNIIIKNDLIEKSYSNNYTENTIIEAQKILKMDKKQLLASNFTIKTYQNNNTQRQISDIIDDKKFSQNCDFVPNKMGICVDNSTRGITAFDSNFEVNAFDYRRQIGSTLKPLAVYAPAFDLGIVNQMTKLNDSPTDFDGYCPHNYMDIYLGKASVRDCLIHSQNVPAVQLLSMVGIDKSINYLQKMNFAVGKNDRNQSLALGSVTNGNSILELCGGYTTLAMQGQFKNIGFIKTIIDDKNNIVYEHSKLPSKQVFTAEASYLVTDILKDCAKEGTAKKLSSINFDVASKTGTVAGKNKDFNTDIFNASYTPDNTLVFWQGSLSGQLMPVTMSGGGQTTAMAKEFYDNFDIKKTNFDIPNGILSTHIDRYSYDNLDKFVVASDNCPIKQKIAATLDKKFLTTEKDNSFDKLIVNGATIKEESGQKFLVFYANPRLNYEIFEKELFCTPLVIKDITFADGQMKIALLNYNDFFTTYSIVPYYYDDNFNKICGLPFLSNMALNTDFD